jgi:hypothetical protein
LVGDCDLARNAQKLLSEELVASSAIIEDSDKSNIIKGAIFDAIAAGCRGSGRDMKDANINTQDRNIPLQADDNFLLERRSCDS